MTIKASHDISIAQQQIQALREHETLLVNVAQRIIDNHWIFIESEQKRIIKQKALGKTSDKLFVIAPVIYYPNKKVEKPKPYIAWMTWHKNRVEDGKHISQRLKPLSRGYTPSFFNKYCEMWLLERALATEQAIEPIRKQLEANHEHIIKLNRIVRSRSKESQHG